jgi:hypothetical protein
MRALLAIIVITFATHASISLGGTVLTIGISGSDSGTQTWYLDDGKMRIIAPQAGIIYLKDLNKIFELDFKTQSYKEISRATRENLEGMVETITSSCAKSRRLDAESIETPQAADGKPSALRKVGRWSCLPAVFPVSEKVEIETCSSKMADLGLTVDDLKVLIDFAGALGLKDSLSKCPSLPDRLNDPGWGSSNYIFPIQSIFRSKDDKFEFRFTVQTVENVNLPDGTFDVSIE